MLEDIDALRGLGRLLRARRTPCRGFRSSNWKGGASYRVDFPEPIYSPTSTSNAEFDDERRSASSYESFTTPPSIYDFDMATKERKLLKQHEVLGGYDAVALHLRAALRDGRRRHEDPDLAGLQEGLRRRRQGPDAPDGLRLLRRALATPTSTRTSSACSTAASSTPIGHIRGGGDLGKKWHDQGRMMSKKNTFTDFIAVRRGARSRTSTPRRTAWSSRAAAPAGC